jgi:hypothetical protein
MCSFVPVKRVNCVPYSQRVWSATASVCVLLYQ